MTVGQWQPAPTVGIIFAFESIKMETLAAKLNEWCADVPPAERPDAVFVLGDGYLTWVDSQGNISPWVREGLSLSLLNAPAVGDVLFPFMIYLNMYFSEVSMRPLRLLDYAGDRTLGATQRRWKP